ncbi:Arm DNA-binding domain-containing protein [Algoriphagus boritolerans]|uniref:Arm DNA-binding domain-containing protein n=1 Tax=Algoriphagus boritolerans TaxID=308111 RepID=UPI003A0FC609
MMSVTQTNLVLQRWKPTKQGKFPVVIRIYSDKKRRYFRTGVSVLEKDWDEKSASIPGRARDNKKSPKPTQKKQKKSSKGSWCSTTTSTLIFSPKSSQNPLPPKAEKTSSLSGSR